MISLTIYFFRISKIELDLSMMRISYKLKKNNKNWKVWKIIKKYNIINFKTIRYKMTTSGNINPWILNYKLLRQVSVLRLPKDF